MLRNAQILAEKYRKCITVNQLKNDMTELPTFCHITPEYYAPFILDEGILSDCEGYIYMFIDGALTHSSGRTMTVSDIVALSLGRIQTNHYFKFLIDPKGITVPIETAYCDHWGAGYHRKIRQERIKREFIKVVDYRAVVKNEAVEMRNMCIAEKLGIPYEGQPYRQLNQLIADREAIPNDDFDWNRWVIEDTWEHGRQPDNVTPDNSLMLEIIQIRNSLKAQTL